MQEKLEKDFDPIVLNRMKNGLNSRSSCRCGNSRCTCAIRRNFELKGRSRSNLSRIDQSFWVNSSIWHELDANKKEPKKIVVSTLGWAQWNLSSLEELRQPTGQRQSNIRMQQFFFQSGQSYSIVRKDWHHQIWIQNYLGFIVSDLMNMDITQWGKIISEVTLP